MAINGNLKGISLLAGLLVMAGSIGASYAVKADKSDLSTCEKELQCKINEKADKDQVEKVTDAANRIDKAATRLEGLCEKLAVQVDGVSKSVEENKAEDKSWRSDAEKRFRELEKKVK